MRRNSSRGNCHICGGRQGTALDDTALRSRNSCYGGHVVLRYGGHGSCPTVDGAASRERIDGCDSSHRGATCQTAPYPANPRAYSGYRRHCDARLRSAGGALSETLLYGLPVATGRPYTVPPCPATHKVARIAVCFRFCPLYATARCHSQPISARRRVAVVGSHRQARPARPCATLATGLCRIALPHGAE